jgi:hypothetical protein
MTSQSPRIYIYKITFEEVLYYYYGVHKENKFDEYYMGSPYTHKWVWDFYTPKKQILQLFEFSDKGWLEANLVEDRLIKPFYNTDKWCLNENCGGNISLSIRRKTGIKIGQKTYELGIGVHGRTKKQIIEDGKKGGKISGKKNKENKIGICGLSFEQRKEVGGKGGNKAKELGIGIHTLTKEQMTENGKRGGKIGGKISVKLGLGAFGRSPEKIREDSKKGGKKAGKISKENKTGVCGRSKEKMSEDGKKGAKVVNSQRWMCTETGFISTPGGLSKYQKKRGIDTSKRKRIA